MTETSGIEKQVMRRVRRIALLRILISGGVFAIALALLALYGLGREVWVAMVFANGPSGFAGHAFYLLYAFEHTRFVVQALCLVALGSFLFLARELARFLSTTLTPRRASL
ncbi:MAG TPA: hypothetical protein VHC68_02680 [Candidatus Paceibacterota bacterium]|nr:hypothetical protein [Candidatus Paceibacterota bacterium]